MAWHTPFTFTAGTSLTAEDINKYLFDNMNETLVGKLQSGSIPTTEGQWFSTNGVNSVVGRQIKGVSTTGTGTRTASSTYGVTDTNVDGFINPSVTAETGPNALVLWHAGIRPRFESLDLIECNTETTLVSIAVSGATTIPADDNYAISAAGAHPFVPSTYNTTRTGTVRDFSNFFWFQNLTPGSNTFTMHSRHTTGLDSIILNADILVIPFG